MENTVYWNNTPVGIESNGRILWFTGAPTAAIEAYK